MTSYPPPLPRPTSIEYALALERDLNMDTNTASDNSSIKNDADFDPEVLSHLVLQLRTEVAKVSLERDDAIAALTKVTLSKASLEAKAADFADLVEEQKGKLSALEKERDDALKKAHDEEEQVVMLREKVEEARRGVMRLQAENRRQISGNKPNPLDLSQSRNATSNPPSSLTSAKRSSFIVGSGVPPSRAAQGGGHRRISSMSDSAVEGGAITAPLVRSSIDPECGSSQSPASPSFENSVNGSGSTIKTKRLSLLNRRDDMPLFNPFAAELDSVRAELASTRKDLLEAKKELHEASDAQIANEACLKALKDFIEENSVGLSPPSIQTSPNLSLKGLRLPPLPADIKDEDEQPHIQQPAKSGWAGLKLWRENSSSTSSSAVPSANSRLNSPPNPEGPATPLTSFVSNWTRSVSVSSPPSQPTGSTPPSCPSTSINSTIPPTTQQNNSFTKKFGFFGGKNTGSVPASAPSISLPTQDARSSPETDVTSLPSMVSSTAASDAAFSEPSSPLIEVEGLVQVLLSPAKVSKDIVDAGNVTPTLDGEASLPPAQAYAL